MWLKLAVALALAWTVGIDTGRAGGWYVGNTAATEWIRYKKVWLTAGTYRFTARAASPVSGATMRIEIDNVAVQSGIAVPNTGRADAFTHVHLGSKAISQGYHDIRIVFESANVSLDWFMLSKDPDGTPTVKTSDITMLRPDTSGMLVAPITAFSPKTATTGLASALCSQPMNDINGQPFSDEQLRTWYSIPMYRDYDRRSDRYWDILIDDLVASRAQVPLLHCRETKDFVRGLRDRDYKEGAGAFEGRWMLKFSEAVARHPQAVDSLKIGMFWENGGLADQFKKLHGYFPAWGDPALVDYAMDHWLGPWFDNVPSSMLYQPIAGRPIISVYSSRPTSIVSDGRMGDFLSAIRSRLQERYGYDPLYILPVGGDVDGGALAQGWGQAPWVTWDGPLLETNTFAGQKWGTVMVGSRRRIDTVWLNDWDPATDTGTGNPADQNGNDSFQSRLDGSNNSVLLNSLAQAKAMGIKLVQEEGFTNIAEGNSVFRSYHPGWTFPNQHLAAMRQYADPTTQTQIFEAEGCDDYFKTVNDGNSGGSYRREWYSGGNNLDVYRPLHNLQSWIQKSSGPGNFVQITAGFYDAWALGADGKIWAQPIMGTPDSWTQVPNAPTLTALSVGKEWVWGLNGTTVYSTKIPYDWAYWTSTGWTQRTGSMVSISATTSRVWATDASGHVYHRHADGTGDWTQVSGTMDKVFAGDEFVWGMQGSNIYYTRTSPISWTQVSNSSGITKLAVGAEEVWGVTASGQVFRRSISGIGGWDAVSAPSGTLSSLSIGEGYVWGLVGNVPQTRRLEGFQGAPALAPMTPRASAGSGQITLTWTAVSGATGYNIKRATASGGPFTTIQSNVLPFSTILGHTDATVSNGTTYYYVVSALTPSGETANSPVASATPQGSAPAAPSGLTATMGFGNRIALAWTDASNNEAGFRIERKKGTGSFVQVAVVPANVKTFSDAIPFGPDFTYRVRAYNPAGASSYTNEVALSTSVTKLDRAGWSVSASVSGGGAAANALDGSLSTRWGTGTAQANGQWFQLDMGGSSTVFQIDLDIVGGDYPRGYEVYLSLDGVNWGSPVTSGVGSSILTTINFAPQTARYIRIVQTGSTTGTWWSIYEINVHGQPGQELSRSGWTFSASVSGGGSPASNAGDNNLSTRWGTGGAQANGQWFQADMGTAKVFHQLVLDAATSTNDYPRGYEVYVSNNGTNWGSPIASGAGASAVTIVRFPEQVARYVRIVQTGSTTGTWWSIHEFRVFGWPALSRAGWTASASVSGGGSPAPNAIDGSIGTRWGTGGAQANGQWFQVDMGTTQTFRRLVLDAAASTNDYPRGYAVHVSSDGTNWGNPVAFGAGSSAQTVIDFPQQTARYVRVMQTGSTGGTWWSIHEFDVHTALTGGLASPTGVTSTAGNNQIGLAWSAVSGATSYTIKRSSSSGGPFTVLASGVTGTSYADTTASNGSTYYYTVSAVNGAGSSPESASFVGTAGVLPSPWATADIGSVGVIGYGYYVNPTYSVAGSGSDIWSSSDNFRYVYQASSGDCEVVARITSQQNTHSGAKAGVMIRETTAAGAMHGAVLVTPSGGIAFQWRSATGALCQSTGGGSITLPTWVRLTRTGNSVAGYKSTDGVNWTQIGTAQTLPMASSALMGVSVTSHNNAAISAVTADNVTATP